MTAENKIKLQKGEVRQKKTHHKEVSMIYPVSFFKHKKLQNMDFIACVCLQP